MTVMSYEEYEALTGVSKADLEAWDEEWFRDNRPLTPEEVEELKTMALAGRQSKWAMA